MSDFRDRVKEAAEEVGGLNRLADLIAVPRRTLGDQIAEKTEPKMHLLVAIARETKYSIGWLATGDGPKREGRKNASLDASLMERLAQLATITHRDVGLTLPGERATFEASNLYNDLAGRVQDITDKEEVELAIPLVLHQLKKRLVEAVAAPGTGKRSA